MRMARLVLILTLLAAPLAAEAQQAAKLPRIGFLALNAAASPYQQEAFLQGLRDLGYLDGRNVGPSRNMTKARAGALTVFATPGSTANEHASCHLAAKNRLPAIYPYREAVDAGGLMSYGPNVPDLFRRAATYVDRILNGARPSNLPVQQATKFDLVINLKTAKALGLTIPPSLMLRADQVIE